MNAPNLQTHRLRAGMVGMGMIFEETYRPMFEALKKVRAATGKAATEAYAEAVKLLDRAGRKRLVHPNTAARHKSRLAKLLGGKK